MVTIGEIKKLIDLAESQYDNLLSISQDERKKYGDAKDDTIQKFNALFFQLQNAYKCIKDGLDGKFPWEV